MDQDLHESDVLVERRREDRRVASHRPPPYVTDEGFVLYDRREGDERSRPERHMAGNESVIPTATEPAPVPAPAPDLVSQRMQHLAAMYGYVSTQARAQAEIAKEIGNDWYRPLTRKSVIGA